MSIALVLGAGASRGVSYARTREIQSPLDRDFFDLLQRLDPHIKDAESVKKTLSWVEQLPFENWRSMELSFYTLHLRAYIGEKLATAAARPTLRPDDKEVVSSFVTATGALLRAAHGTETCEFHQQLLSKLGPRDEVISFNYDLVIERALKAIDWFKAIPFGNWLYGFSGRPSSWSGPTISKMHGSFNWDMPKSGDDTFVVHTRNWPHLEKSPGFLRFKHESTAYPIFLPFWDKRIESGPWLRIWARAFQRLENTTSVIVWGYSLPKADVKAQLTFQGALADRQFNLCVIDPSSSTKDRWRGLFPRAKYWEFESAKDFLDHPPKWWRDRIAPV